ncbi:MAG: SGNH/GDSL hydrolase family protein [Chitinophagia bacterium]|nr:SGNH/GDSL hydrolase family protein [Chitinophagia bacterium]
MLHAYLALGDSYTIGEKVLLENNFPHQLVTFLNRKGLSYTSPEIIAQTGWTTDELAVAIKNATQRNKKYDLVTLLIGVNNQYRGRDINNYTQEFSQLLHTAIGFANDNPHHVVVVSIPDWGVTPFAEDRNREEIAKQIDEFNAVNKKLATEAGCVYIHITPSTRQNGTNPLYLAEDKLHPSAKEYSIWARMIAEKITW